jgi:hypothetical protein
MTNDPNDMSDPRVRPPFWRHRYIYLTLKIAVVVLALWLALRLLGF